MLYSLHKSTTSLCLALHSRSSATAPPAPIHGPNTRDKYTPKELKILDSLVVKHGDAAKNNKDARIADHKNKNQGAITGLMAGIRARKGHSEYLNDFDLGMTDYDLVDP